MKRSKIFLGLTTGLLAIAGVAAAKHYGLSRTRFYITASGAACAPVIRLCTGTGTAFCTVLYTNQLGQPDHQATWTKGDPTKIVPISIDACQGKKTLYDGVHL